LKRFYCLSDDKCQSFNPDDRIHAIDRLQPTQCIEYSPHPITTVPSSTTSTTKTESSASVSKASPGVDVAVVASSPPRTSDYHTTLNHFIEYHFKAFIKHYHQQQNMTMRAPLDPKIIAGFLTILREIVMDFNRVSILLNNDPVDFTVTKRVTKKQQQHDKGYVSADDDGDDRSVDNKSKNKGVKRKPSIATVNVTSAKKKKVTSVRKSKYKKRRLNVCSDDEDGDDEDDDDYEE